MDQRSDETLTGARLIEITNNLIETKNYEAFPIFEENNPALCEMLKSDKDAAMVKEHILYFASMLDIRKTVKNDELVDEMIGYDFAMKYIAPHVGRKDGLTLEKGYTSAKKRFADASKTNH